uniref:Uncharacterized protein n=1 Tax=Cannabis sativa TaxID=3483 RepID=A0A803QNN1_CANSA
MTGLLRELIYFDSSRSPKAATFTESLRRSPARFAGGLSRWSHADSFQKASSLGPSIILQGLSNMLVKASTSSSSLAMTIVPKRSRPLSEWWKTLRSWRWIGEHPYGGSEVETKSWEPGIRSNGLSEIKGREDYFDSNRKLRDSGVTFRSVRFILSVMRYRPWVNNGRLYGRGQGVVDTMIRLSLRYIPRHFKDYEQRYRLMIEVESAKDLNMGTETLVGISEELMRDFVRFYHWEPMPCLKQGRSEARIVELSDEIFEEAHSHILHPAP